MTKKDYIVIARVFNTTTKIWTDARAKWQAKEYGDREQAAAGAEKVDGINKILASMNVIVRGLSHELKKDNPKFDAQKFAAACGMPEVKQERIHEAVAAGLDAAECLHENMSRDNTGGQCRDCRALFGGWADASAEVSEIDEIKN